jgi:hypothetical protein
MSRNKNVENLVNSMENAKHLLPSVYTVPITEEANGPSVDVIAFDFVPQLLSLLQNRDIMTKENLLIDLQNDPLARYKSPGNLRGEALSGQVYQDAYKRLITDPKRQLFVPIIQWVDRTHVTGDGWFSLKPESGQKGRRQYPQLPCSTEGHPCNFQHCEQPFAWRRTSHWAERLYAEM